MNRRVYITGDLHGDINRVLAFCYETKTTKNDVLIVLGDVGLNYFLDERDQAKKDVLQKLPITLFCIHGNHEERPANIKTYKKSEFWNGKVFVEPKYPNIIFAVDGQIYNIEGNSCLVLGGAYSVDKWHRLNNGQKWFDSEQIPDKEKRKIEVNIREHGWEVDYVLSHTCPYNVRPIHLFLKSIDQSTVDSSMEVWLQKIADRLAFKRWYFGHFHDEWDNDKYSMMYTDIMLFPACDLS